MNTNSNADAPVILPFTDRLNNRAIAPRSQVCRKCNGTRRDAKTGGKCKACQGEQRVTMRSKAA